MKVIVIGGVAAGTKAAAKIKREDRSAQVEVYTRSNDISYAGCGLPYYVGGDIETRDELIVNSPEKFAALTGAAAHTGEEAIAVDVNDNSYNDVRVRNACGARDLEEEQINNYQGG